MTESAAKQNIQRLTIGMGCFWCGEAIFKRLKGVLNVTSGYAGGSTPNPTYEEVCNGDSGHIEVVQIEFDPQLISYSQLLEIFWHMHNPTTLNKQGADSGTQYRSVIFFENDREKSHALESKKKAQLNFQDPIVTQIVPLDGFYPAESYHQSYYDKNESAPYCQYVIAPKIQKLIARFNALVS